MGMAVGILSPLTSHALEFLHFEHMHRLTESSQQFWEVRLTTDVTEAQSVGESTPIPHR